MPPPAIHHGSSDPAGASPTVEAPVVVMVNVVSMVCCRMASRWLERSCNSLRPVSSAQAKKLAR